MIDPPDAETRGFVLLPLSAAASWLDDASHDALQGCLEDRAAALRVCGQVLPDTGAGRIALINSATAPTAWTGPTMLSFGGAPQVLMFTPGRSDYAADIVGGRDQAMPQPMILAGVMPYLNYDVLYDPERKMIGLRPRLPSPHGPRLEP